jgi:ribosomal protein S18 acetylase RimI-like enzyme
VVEFRAFQNDDPPALVDIWNAAFPGRGAAILRHSSPLERYAFSKPYFDRTGLIVAVEDQVRVGFVHAGFGANPTETGISFSAGVTCVLGVRPSHRGRGVGTELLRRSEQYLLARGANALYAGATHPLNPFYFGLYGGSEQPGFLESDSAAAAFFQARGYSPSAKTLALQKRLDRPANVVDGRFPGLRRRFQVEVLASVQGLSWWHECVLGPVEPVEFRLQETASGQLAGRVRIWEMEGLSWRWGAPSVGLVDLFVHEPFRRQGLAKLLLANVLQYLQDQYFAIVEVQVGEINQPVVALFRGLGFEPVDAGTSYQKRIVEKSAAEKESLPSEHS